MKKKHTKRIRFMMVMTETLLMVQPYLPFMNGVEGIVIEIGKEGDNNDNLYSFYKSSYEQLFGQVGNPKQALQHYADRKKLDVEVVRRLEDLFEAMGIQYK